jgi:hypothetical protein
MDERRVFLASAAIIAARGERLAICMPTKNNRRRRRKPRKWDLRRGSRRSDETR